MKRKVTKVIDREWVPYVTSFGIRKRAQDVHEGIIETKWGLVYVWQWQRPCMDKIAVRFETIKDGKHVVHVKHIDGQPYLPKSLAGMAHRWVKELYGETK